MVSQLEKTHGNKLAKEILDELGIWSERIPDVPYIHEGGAGTYKKPFDRLICCRGIAVEFKYRKGLTFNLKAWKENKRTRHQFMNLKRFAESNSGLAVLFVFWKKAKTRNIQRVWMPVQELEGDKIRFEDMYEYDKLVQVMKKWRIQ